MIEILIFAAGFVGYGVYAFGYKRGKRLQKQTDSMICERAVRSTMSPTARAIWRRVDGLTTVSEMDAELKQCAYRTKEYTADKLMQIADVNKTDLEGTLEVWMEGE